MKTRNREVVVNLLIALGVSLIVNFSYFILTLMPSHQMWMRDAGMSHYNYFVWLLVVYYTMFAFILLCITTGRIDRRGSQWRYAVRILCCIAIAVVFYFLSPVNSPRDGLGINLMSHRPVNAMALLKVTFTLVVTVLYGKIFELVYHKQRASIEIEQLRNDNLMTQYNMLVSQVNPHFLFNSLNSLAMLVRERHNDKALIYIDRLSDTFRYVIQSGRNDLTTLADELDFLSSYKYLLEIRYADKLFFDLAIDEKYAGWRLPAITLQPLIENAVKHNSITLARPFHISISTGDEQLVVSNPVIPKLVAEKGTGIGLQNLSSRALLLTGRNIDVVRTDDTFSIHIPLISPAEP